MWCRKRQRFRALQRQDLTRLVDTRDDGVVGQVEIEADDIVDILDEERVSEQLGTCGAGATSGDGCSARCTYSEFLPMSPSPAPGSPLPDRVPIHAEELRRLTYPITHPF